jgi:hypothetical protein
MFNINLFFNILYDLNKIFLKLFNSELNIVYLNITIFDNYK